MNITEHTKIPLFAVIIALPTIAGVIFWLAMVSTKSEATTERVDRVVEKIHRMESVYESHQEQMMHMLTEVRDRTVRMEQWEKDHDK